MTELIDIADETHRLIETSRQLSEKSAELTDTANQLREANERLRTLDAQKDEFLSQVSHELRTPMTSIRSFADILLSNSDVPADERQRFVTIIHEESQRLTRLLDEILDIGRLEAGSLDLPMEPTDADEVISAALDTVSAELMTHGVEVHRADVPVGAVVMANGDRMRQVLINVLANAVKYNDAPSPRIDVTASLDGGFLNIDVMDNGGGVSREEAVTVFEKFSRGRQASRGLGAGLGLPISRAIMRTMGGELSVEFASEASSYFRIRLVLARSA